MTARKSLITPSSPLRSIGDRERRGNIRSFKSKSSGQPLRRGDACLMCRAKKLKCSAQKPACDQCAKRDDRCVYDAVRPASRVEKLERKLAAIEEQELHAAVLQRRFSADAYPHLHLQAHEVGTPILGSLDYRSMGLQPPTVASIFSGGHSQVSPQFEQQQSLSWPTAGPGAFTPASVSSQTTMLNQPMPGEPVQLDSLPWTLLNATPDVSTYWPEGSNPASSHHASSSASPQVQGLEALNAMFPIPTVVPPQPIAPPLLDNPYLSIPDVVNQTVEEVISQAASLGTNRMGEREISQSARNYLLDLFFCPDPPRPQFGSEVFTEAQFRARLSLAPEDQPHDCILFAMYTVAASHSYIPAVKSLESALFAIAAHKVEEAIAHEDRLVDAINTSKTLSKWLFSKSRPLEAYQYSWKAASLCMACNLHRIPSSVFNPVKTEESKMDIAKQWPLLGPPRDQWDLCQRIHAFWSTWGNDRGMMLIIPWKSAFRDEQVTTPLPRPLEDFLNGTIEREIDVTLRDLYDLPHRDSPSGLDFFYGIYMSGVHVLSRARSLLNEPPESRPSFRGLALEPPTNVRTPRKDYPLAYKEMMDVCDWIEGNLPSETAVRLQNSPPWDNPDVPVLHMCYITTRMFLHPMDGDDFDRETGVRAALQASALIGVWIEHLQKAEGNSFQSGSSQQGRSGPDPTATSRHKNGISGPYCLTAWCWVADRLVKGAVFYRAQARFDEARNCTREAQKIVEGLKALGLWTRLTPQSALETATLERATRRGLDDLTLEAETLA